MWGGWLGCSWKSSEYSWSWRSARKIASDFSTTTHTADKFCCQSTLLKDCRRESESLKSPYVSAGRTSGAQAARPHAGLRTKPATNCLGKHCTTVLPGSGKNSKTCFILFCFFSMNELNSRCCAEWMWQVLKNANPTKWRGRLTLH